MSRKTRTPGRNNFVAFTCFLLATAWLAGCTTNKMTTTPRTATEQLLLSTATDHALQSLGLEIFAGRRVFLDGTYFDSYDSKYVLGTVRDALSRAGARLVDVATNSEIVVEARSGALAIDESDTMFGIPSIGVPIPLSGTVQTPEIAFYKVERQRSVAKFALLAYTRRPGAHVYSSGPLDGRSFDKHSRVLFVSWHRTDVPEKQREPAKMQEAQTWFPQSDLENLTETNGPAK
jgi:hypothetical protein